MKRARVIIFFSDIVATRYVFAVAGFFGLMHLYVQRLNLSVAIVAMVRMAGVENTTVDTGCNFITRNATAMEMVRGLFFFWFLTFCRIGVRRTFA